MPLHSIESNTLFYGDNLDILREYIPSASIDLIYLDPPFNSSRNYNVLFKDESGKDSEAQIQAFTDTWHWSQAAEHTYHELVTEAPERVSKVVEALRTSIGTNQMMAYLVMMTARLVELHRVLKASGSLYLHCDPTASHYLKVVLDAIFDPERFVNEIIWKRTTTGKAKRVLVQVKSGHVTARDIRDLRGTVERENAAIGVFITLEPPTREMQTEAVSAGFYHSPGWGRDYPKIQLLTIADLLRGAEVQMPPQYGTFKQAQRVRARAGEQVGLDLDI